MKTLGQAGSEGSGARSQAVWSLHRSGRSVSCVVTDVAGGGYELTVVRSDAPASTYLHAVRDEAMAEARRLATSYIAHGWATHGDTR